MLEENEIFLKIKSIHYIHDHLYHLCFNHCDENWICSCQIHSILSLKSHSLFQNLLFTKYLIIYTSTSTYGSTISRDKPKSDQTRLSLVNDYKIPWQQTIWKKIDVKIKNSKIHQYVKNKDINTWYSVKICRVAHGNEKAKLQNYA